MSGQTDLGGLVESDLTLFASNGVHTVTSDLTIAAGATLTIEPGVTVRLNAGRMITVRGRLWAAGTSNAPIHFMRATAGTTWERIMFIEAEPSLFRYCVIQHADCEGDHKIYADDDCNPNTPPPRPRNYFQAIVALASHLDIENCTFQNLPNEGDTAHGDAIAIISDDPDVPGTASAQIRGCEFLRIGQAIHTRFAHVLVENCFFTGHRNDNDNVDLYGESLPPSLILNNRMLNASDDMMNPTRSSAVIIGNIVGDSGDSGVVLRDRCCPVMINNVVYGCNSAGIDVQNTCDAVLVNNTVVNCGTAINFRDHTARYTSPYCLTPGAATATVINCILWDCNRAFNLVNSDSANQPGSEATVIHCNVEGGQANANVSSRSVLRWEGGNINSNPLFVNLGSDDYRLTAASPCIDAGTNVNLLVSITNQTGLLTNLTVTVEFDLQGVPRPLDGDGDGVPVHDIGAYEFLRPESDSNADGIPDGWTWAFGLDPTDPGVGAANPDDDPHTTFEEWQADTDPTDPNFYLKIESISVGPPVVIHYRSSANRRYTLYYAPDLGDGNGSTIDWMEVPGQVDQPGAGGEDSLSDPDEADARHYRIGVSVP